MTIGDRIRKFRDEKNISTYKLSELTGIPQSTISKLENGKRKSDSEVLGKIADALEISVERLTGESVSCIIEDRLEELGMTLEDIASKSKVPEYWLKNIDTFIPGEFGGNNEIGYTWISQVAEVIGVPGATLRAALARQEIPVYDGTISSAEEDFFNNVESNTHKSDNVLLINYNKLNDKGKYEAIKRVEELSYIYRNENAIIKENDYQEFIIHVGIVMEYLLTIFEELQLAIKDNTLDKNKLYDESIFAFSEISKIFPKVKKLLIDEKKYETEYKNNFRDFDIRINETDHLILNAAHEIEGASEEDRQHDEDIMNDDNF